MDGRDDRTRFDNYSSRRDSSATLRDGLQRRTDLVADLLAGVGYRGGFRLLDVGTADGKMLARLHRRYLEGKFIGAEASKGLARAAREAGLSVVVGDARSLPFPDGSFDIVLLSATLKHVRQYRQVLGESRRVLAPSGHLIILEPTPHGIRLGLLAGHFDRRYLHNVWSLGETARRLAEYGFVVESGIRYMASPVRLPGDTRIESALRVLGLDRLFMQQATLARVAEHP